jgi:hypothetical protein
VVTARAERIRALEPGRRFVPGQLARHSGLGCPNGRRCLLCHYGPGREPSRQELVSDDPREALREHRVARPEVQTDECVEEPWAT